MKISVIYSGRLNAPNGASNVVKKFRDNTDRFANNEIVMSGVYVSKDDDEVKYHVKSNGRHIKTLIKKRLSKSLLGNIISIYLQYFSNAIKSVGIYNKTSDKSEDVIVFHDIFSCYIYHKRFKKMPKRAILVMHTNGDTWKMLYEYFPKIKRKVFISMLAKIEDFVCEKVSRIVFVSKTSKENFDQLKSKFKNKSTYIYNGIENLEGQIDKNFDILNLITVGTLNGRKAQDLILKALKNINDKSITLSLVGDGEKREEFYRYAKENSMLSQVEFLGSRDDVDNILKSHNLFIMSSKDEGLPISIIEAMRSGLPIIATDVGGIKELINGNGLLVEPTVDSITSAIEHVKNNKRLLISMSERSYEIFLDKFEVCEMIDRYSNLVKEVYYEK